jgi:hypothetical protein
VEQAAIWRRVIAEHAEVPQWREVVRVAGITVE